MPTQIACDECGTQLKVPDNMAGREVRCPRCAATFSAPDDERADAADVRPAAPSRRTPPKGVQVGTSERPASSEGGPGQETAAAPPPRKKKRRKRQQEPALPGWLKKLLIGGACAIALFIAVVVLLMGMKRDAAAYFVVVLVMLPISTGILILAMYISSALGGGIDFGDARVVIPKAMALIFVINLIGLVPFGFLFTFPVWLFGLMSLFKLDLWETRVLVTVNWILNFVARWAVLAIIFSAMGHMAEKGDMGMGGPGIGGGGFGGGGMGGAGMGGRGMGGAENPWAVQPVEEPEGDVEAITALGGRCTMSDGPDSDVVGIDLSDTAVTDADLKKLRGFPVLRKLDLSRTAVTNAGMKKLTHLGFLQELTLTGTAVDHAGVRKIKRALPNVHVTR